MDPQNPVPQQPNPRPDFTPPPPARRDFMFQPAPRLSPQPLQPTQPLPPSPQLVQPQSLVQPMQPQPQPPTPIFSAPNNPVQPVAPAFSQQAPAAPILPPQQPYFGQPAQPANQIPEESNKEYVPAVLLSWLTGNLGIDRFYLGYTITGILKLLTFGGLGLWSLIDLGRIIYGKLKDKQGRQLRGYEQHNHIFKVVYWVLLIMNLVIVSLILVALVVTTFSGVQVKARDAERKSDIQTLHTQLGVYYLAKGNYPTLEQLNDQAFRAKQLPNVQDILLQDPQASSTKLVPHALRGQYGYSPAPLGCDNLKIRCTDYQLQAYLENGGQVFTRTNLTF